MKEVLVNILSYLCATNTTQPAENLPSPHRWVPVRPGPYLRSESSPPQSHPLPHVRINLNPHKPHPALATPPPPDWPMSWLRSLTRADRSGAPAMMQLMKASTHATCSAVSAPCSSWMRRLNR